MKKITLLFSLLIFLSLSVFSQTEYEISKAKSYLQEAEYYQKKADNYRKEAAYYLDKAKNYQQEVEYYAKKNDTDNVRTYTRYLNDAIASFKTQLQYAMAAEENAISYLKRAENQVDD